MGMYLPISNCALSKYQVLLLKVEKNQDPNTLYLCTFPEKFSNFTKRQCEIMRFDFYFCAKIDQNCTTLIRG